MEVLDCGVGILSMHAPWEISSVADLVMMTRGYHAFLEYKDLRIGQKRAIIQ